MSFKENRTNHSLDKSGFFILQGKEVSLLPRVLACIALVVLFCCIALPAFAELQDTQGYSQDYTQSQQDYQLNEPSSNYTNTIRPVSVNELNTKLNHLLDMALGFSGSLLVKLAMLMMIVSAFFTAVGWLFRLNAPKDLGIRGLVMSSFGLLVFWSIPFIVRMINAVAKVLNS